MMKTIVVIILVYSLNLLSDSLADSTIFFCNSSVIETDYGNIRFTFFEKEAPNHVKNFRENIESGFYEGKEFNRIVPDFIIQAGGNHGEKEKTLPPEISKLHFKGALASARKDTSVNPDMNSDAYEFYICVYSQPDLDGKYTVFGRCAEGFDVVKAISRCGNSSGKPSKKILINKTYNETYFDSEKYDYYNRKYGGENK